MIDLNEVLDIDKRMHVATAYGNASDLSTALTIYRSVLDLNPGHIEALCNCATIAIKKNQPGAARQWLDQALAVNPDYPHALTARADLLKEQGRYGAAMTNYRRALEIQPDPGVWSNLAYLQQLFGHSDLSIKSYESAMALKPDNLELRFFRSMSVMLNAKTQAEWDHGLGEYELRHAVYRPLCPLPENGKPVWTITGVKSEIKSPRILLCAEQGIGDCVMMARYATILRREFHASEVHLMCPEAWKGLMQLGTFDSVVAPGQDLPDYDCHISILSLLLHTRYPGVPRQGFAYFSKPSCNLVLPAGRFRIGVAWQGSRAHANDRYRSCSPDRFEAAFSHLKDDAEFYSLQVPEETQWAPSWFNNCEIDSLDKLAAAIAGMDLVVTIDSAPLHIAGAMGIPTLAMIPVNPDWRWGITGDTTSWYESVRLFRATAPKSWGPVLEKIAKEIEARIALWRESP